MREISLEVLPPSLPMKIDKYFAKKLGEVIATQDVGAQTKLAGKLDITRGAINNILKGRRGTDEDLRRKISKIMEMDYDGIIRDYLSEYPPPPISGTSSSIQAANISQASIESEQDGDLSKPKLVGMAIEVLESESLCGRALESNIIAFHKSIQGEKKAMKMEEKIDSLERKIDLLTSMLESKDVLVTDKKETKIANG